MAKEIFINVRPNQTRIAFVEDKELRDLKIDRRTSRTMVGSIFKGRVSKIIPGMQSAFVDLGVSRSGFLYVGDVKSEAMKEDENLYIEEDLAQDKKEQDKTSPTEEISELSLQETQNSQKIEDLLKEGEEIMVQVSKDPLGTKGARITTHISLAGRFMVYLPLVSHLGISRKIEDQSERNRLKKIIDSLSSKKEGFILRTAAGGVKPQLIKDDLILNCVP